MLASSPRLLVLRALGVGDLLAAVPAYRGLRRAFDRHWVVLAAPPALAPLAVLTGAVDEVLPYAMPSGEDWPPLPWLGGPPDLAVNLHGRGPRSHATLTGMRPRRLWGFAHSAFPEIGGPAWVEGEHEVARWCRLLGHYRVAADPGDLALAVPPDRVPARAGAVVVHPGAAHPSRRWPVDRFGTVAAALRAAGHPVVVTGSATERGLAVAVAEHAGLDRVDVLAGRTDVLDLAALIAAARLVVCGDTGIGHLATAYGTPSVLLFGPTPPAERGPPPDRDQHTVLWPTAAEPDAALAAISVTDVLAAATALLDRDPPAEPPEPPEPWVAAEDEDETVAAAAPVLDTP